MAPAGCSLKLKVDASRETAWRLLLLKNLSSRREYSKVEDEEIDRLTKRSDELIQQSKELIDKSHEVIDESSTLKELARQVKEKRRKKIPPGQP